MCSGEATTSLGYATGWGCSFQRFSLLTRRAGLNNTHLWKPSFPWHIRVALLSPPPTVNSQPSFVRTVDQTIFSHSIAPEVCSAIGSCHFGKVFLAVLGGNAQHSTWVASEKFPIPVSNCSMERCVEGEIFWMRRIILCWSQALPRTWEETVWKHQITVIETCRYKSTFNILLVER